MSLSYKINKSTILRFGAGVFHQNFSIGNYLQMRQLNGVNRTEIVIQNPLFPDPFAGGILQTVPASLRIMSSSLVATYTNNFSGSVEKSLNGRSTISIAYDYRVADAAAIRPPTQTATLYVYIQNAFNHRNFNTPSGVMTSPFLGQSTSAQTPRVVEVGIRFNF